MNYPVQYGHYNLIPDSLPCESEFTLKLRPMDLRVQWRRCSLTADYISNYCSYQEKLDSGTSNTISIVINELIENAAKFSKDRKGEIFLDLKYYSEMLKIEIKNLTDEISKNKLEKSISVLTDRNSDETYINKLKKGEKNDSGIGLLLLSKDFPVRLGFLINEVSSATYEVIVRAYLDLNEVIKTKFKTLNF
ncbi:slr1658 superfamily regulator [Leptospira noguchii]|uniref:GHKL domain protein n=2 Tax=Leptospira noguchii TaxID=28182 RepID=M6UCI8_9LEPT|nr:histidine kinase [Leptospira noguchii]EKR74929.1 GHKL domain protein [Leptospira noguchii str. 2006001870]EMO40526.1 GHKL domain protein [Leptospira noguchii serovar Autumnalis str. ZUN142]EMS86278.1 GHKL domain protein [Leptospira noguchii str. Cascata]EMS89061.1 GHKL domain protein [Leptospira noguchii str. Hook]TQE64662.1 ATP-binding protein [Leptospira noguchii]